HVHHHVEVTRRAPVTPGAAPSLQADALAVVDTGRDAHLDLTRSALDARAPTSRARRLDDHPPARAPGTGAAERERALVLVDHAPAAALRADDGARSRRRARAMAGAAGGFARDVHGGRYAIDGVEERSEEHTSELQSRFDLVC